MGRGFGFAELGNKAELDQLGLELWLNLSLEDSPGWWGGGVQWWGGGGGEKLGIKLKLSFSWGLGLAELGNNIPSLIFIQDIIRNTMLMPYTSRGFNVLANNMERGSTFPLKESNEGLHIRQVFPSASWD